MASEDLIIVDETFQQIGASFQKKGKEYEELGRKYIRLMKKAKASGLVSGEAADALEAYIQLATRLTDCALLIGSNMENLIETYLADIDNKDQYIF